MRALSSIFAVGGISDLQHPTAWLLDSMLGRQTHSGVRVTPETSLGLSAYFACIRNVAEDIGGLPFKLFRQLKPIGKEPLVDHPLYWIIHDEPNDDQSSMTFWELLVQWALGWGGGYAEIVRKGNNEVASLHSIHPNRVTPRRDPITHVLRYEISNNDGTRLVLPQQDVFHLRGIGDDLVGYSVAQIGAESIGRALATQEFSAAFFGQGSTHTGVFTHPGKLDLDARKRLRESWPTGLPSAHTPMFLEGGMTWAPISVPPEQAQMLETMKFTVEDVARWFRMPPHKIQMLDRATFSNIEAQAREYVGDTLLSWIRRIEHEVNRKLIPAQERPEVFAQFTIRGLLRGDLTAQAEFYKEMFGIGVFSQNEIRDWEDMNPIEGGDVHLVPSNLVPIEDVGKAEEETPAAMTFDTDVEDDDGDDAEATAVASLIVALKTAHARVFEDTLGRLVAKEVKSLQWAIRRHQDEGHFHAWSVAFYADHEAYCHREMTAPALALAEAVCAACGVVPLPKVVADDIATDTKDWAYSFATVVGTRDAAREAIATLGRVPKELASDVSDRVCFTVYDTMENMRCEHESNTEQRGASGVKR